MHLSSSRVRIVLFSAACAAVGLSALGCGPSYPESDYPPQPPPGVSADPQLAPPPPGSVWRRDVNEVLDAGLGRFLQRVELAPEVESGGFVGFRVEALRPADWWQGVDLSVGDVILQVNGMPIEQPTQAHAAFESLRTTNRLVVSYRRGSEPRELVYTILDKPLTGPTPNAALAPAQPSAPAPAAAAAAATPPAPAPAATPKP